MVGSVLQPAKQSHVADLKFCSVWLEDNAYFPWIYLVPKKENVKSMAGLTMEERLQLMREIALCEEAMSESLSCDEINVGIIGMNTQQLSVSIVCRRKHDKDWPKVVWGGSSKPYTSPKKQEMIDAIEKAIKIKMADGKYMQF